MNQGIVARDGDVWVSVPVKSGTNWLLNVVHQLLSGADAEFESIHGVVSWPEFVERPGQVHAEKLERFEALPTDQRRVFKTHAGPGLMPFVRAGEGKDVRYVVACRNPEEALVSFRIFLEKHTHEFFEMWDASKAALMSFESFYYDMIDAQQLQGMFFDFVATWWPLRHESNVQMFHFSDLKRDLPGAVRKIASFIGAEPDAQQWPRIDEHCSFEWMKEHQDKFDTFPVEHNPVPILERGAMIRKGKLGAAHEDGMTDAISEHLRSVGARICRDPAALEWLYEGGALP